VLPDHLIIDFESTFIIKEPLDELAYVAPENHPQKKRLDKMKSLTKAGLAE